MRRSGKRGSPGFGQTQRLAKGGESHFLIHCTGKKKKEKECAPTEGKKRIEKNRPWGAFPTSGVFFPRGKKISGAKKGAAALEARTEPGSSPEFGEDDSKGGGKDSRKIPLISRRKPPTP